MTENSLSDVVIRSEQRIIHLEEMLKEHSEETKRFMSKVYEHEKQLVEIKRDRWWLTAVFAGLWSFAMEFFKRNV